MLFQSSLTRYWKKLAKIPRIQRNEKVVWSFCATMEKHQSENVLDKNLRSRCSCIGWKKPDMAQEPVRDYRVAWRGGSQRWEGYHPR